MDRRVRIPYPGATYDAGNRVDHHERIPLTHAGNRLLAQPPPAVFLFVSLVLVLNLACRNLSEPKKIFLCQHIPVLTPSKHFRSAMGGIAKRVKVCKLWG